MPSFAATTLLSVRSLTACQDKDKISGTTTPLRRRHGVGTTQGSLAMPDSAELPEIHLTFSPLTLRAARFGVPVDGCVGPATEIDIRHGQASECGLVQHSLVEGNEPGMADSERGSLQVRDQAHG
jgi:hypothetical protein